LSWRFEADDSVAGATPTEIDLKVKFERLGPSSAVTGLLVISQWCGIRYPRLYDSTRLSKESNFNVI